PVRGQCLPVQHGGIHRHRVPEPVLRPATAAQPPTALDTAPPCPRTLRGRGLALTGQAVAPMNEGEWQGCASALTLLAWLRQQRVLRFKAGRRKVRLLARAWARRTAAWLDERWVRDVIEACERHADAPEEAGLLMERAMAGDALEAARELAY